MHERVVSLFDAIQLVNAGEPVIDKLYNHGIGWQFLFTMKQNEMFVFPSEDYDPKEIDLMDVKNAKLISPNLFRVQKIAAKNYYFRHHLDTTVENNTQLVGMTYIPIWVTNNLNGIVKVRINQVRLNHLGEIVKVGDY